MLIYDQCHIYRHYCNHNNHQQIIKQPRRVQKKILCLPKPWIFFNIIFAMKDKFDSGDEVEMIIKTQKQSQTGLFTNQRLLLIKAGIVSYFSSIPKEFIGSYRAIELSKQIPKFTIPADEISKVQLNGNQLSFLILKERLINKPDFQKMVKGDNQLLNQRTSRVFKAQNSGYQQWIFKCTNYQHLLEFYRLVNLFRMGNPKFQPSLNSVVQGFQTKKNARKKTVDQGQKPTIDKRYSEVPKRINEFATDLPKKQQPKQKPPLPPAQPLPPLPDANEIIPFMLQPDPEPPKKQQVSINEQQRLLKVIDKLVANNEPILDTISEKPNQDKNSQLSKVIEEANKITIEIIKTFEESKDNIEEKQIPEEEEHQQQETKKQEIQSQEEQLIPQKQQSPEPSEHKPSVLQYNLQSRVEFQIRQKKRKKINQLLKASSLASNYDIKATAKALGMSQQELQQFINVNSLEEDTCWNYIESQLGKILNILGNKNKKQEGQIEDQIPEISYELKQQYHQLSGFVSSSSKVRMGELLEGEMSFESFHMQQPQQLQLLQWMESRIVQKKPRPFSSKIISQTQFNIITKPISFNRDKIIYSKGSWVVNQGGTLEWFLAYLSLQRMVRQFNANQRSAITLECGDVVYLKHIDHQSIVRQLKVGYHYYPLKSIRALQFFFRSKDVIKFNLAYPQFTISVQLIKQGQIYRFHLDRLESSTYRVQPLQHQLKRLIFPLDNELDLFLQSQSCLQLQLKCIDTIYQLTTTSTKITQEALLDIFQKIDNNLEVDIICKLLGARIDKQGNIFFQPTALKLSTRQFGQQISLIRKARKRGNLQFSKDLSRQVMSKLQFYKLFTPTSNFIQIYLQLIDLLIIQNGQLHKAVPVLLKVVNFLSKYQIQQYPVYLSLMKTYLKLGELANFIKIIQNCRLFLSHMFKERSIIFDFPFVRTLVILALHNNPNKSLQITNNLLLAVASNQHISHDLKEKYLSRAIWDKCNILVILNQHLEAFQLCQSQLVKLESLEDSSHPHWIQGVVCLAKCWLQICQGEQVEDLNAQNCAILQKRVQRAIALSLARENFQMTFLLLDTGKKILQKCKELLLPKLLDSLPSFQQAKVEYNSTCQEMLDLIQEIE